MTAYCYDYEVSSNPVSIHCPLWRFMSGLFNAPADFLDYFYSTEYTKLEINENLKKVAEIKDELCFSSFYELESLNNYLKLENFNLRGYRSMLMEFPLRVLVLQAQSYGQLWRRNGFSLINQIFNYSSRLCRTEMFDRDIQLLQVIKKKFI